MKDPRMLVPLLVALLLVPIFVIGLIVYDPVGDGDCDCTGALPATTHAHGVGLVTEIKQDMQLILNVSPAAELYQVVDGNLELCSGDVTDPALKHVTVDVSDARLALGERLPVTVQIEIRVADSDEIVVQAAAPAMYAPGHGYHFGDNFNLPNDAQYDWTVTISPVEALRLEGAQDVWLEPVIWTGSFALDADGNPVGKDAAPKVIGQVTDQGIHIMLSEEQGQTRYGLRPDGAMDVREAEPGSTYFVIDVTDHTVNYEEKLLGASVNAIFTHRDPQGDTEITVQFLPAISPVYGFHYGANVVLDPGTWLVSVEVSGLDFMRHAGPAVTLTRGTVTGEFEYIVPDPSAGAE
ncbi:MAG: hypothetical protein JXA10_08495 [Anaerolineae bacterium]|nr:hypothetical protein [Anaerolineae bacterium]